MKNINIIKREEYSNIVLYKFMEFGIYQDRSDQEETCFRMSLTFELETNENLQYPLEDLLDEFYLYVSCFILSNNPLYGVELAGELEDLQRIKRFLSSTATFRGNTQL